MAKISFPYAPLQFGTVFGVITHDSPKQSRRHGFTQSAVPPPFTQRKLSHGDVCEQVGHVRKTFAFQWELYRLRAPRRGARLAARVRGSAAMIRNRSCKQNSPPISVRAVCFRRRHPTRGFVCTSFPHFDNHRIHRSDSISLIPYNPARLQTRNEAAHNAPSANKVRSFASCRRVST